MASDEGNIGYGQQYPGDTSDDYNTAAFMMRQMIARMSTMRLVKVTAVQGKGTIAAPGTVSVQPLVNQVDGRGNAVPHGIVNAVPWTRIQAGSSALICDPKVDDIGYVVVSDRDISAVKSTGKQSNPGSFRKFDLADGVYIGGLFGGTPTQYVAFTDDRIDVASPKEIRATVGNGHVTLTTSSIVAAFNTATITIDGTHIVLAFGGINITIDGTAIHFNGPTIFNGVASGIAGTVDFGANNIQTTGGASVGSLTSSGAVTGQGTDLHTHTHSGVQPGGGNTGPPV